MKNLAVIAIGGNSLIADEKKRTVPDQYKAICETTKHIVWLVQKGFRVVITHGNGPQVGFILRRAELAQHELHMVPLDSCGADTQGAIGYQIQKALGNHFRKLKIKNNVATVVTQVVVDKNDPSFKNPSKPIGTFMDETTAKERSKKDKWNIVEDAGRGYRRVVPSPLPKKIIEIEAIKTLLDKDFVVIAVGGGGIPVIRDENGDLAGVEAVIDKDFATCLLAQNLNADFFIVSTAVEKVYINFNKPNQKPIDKMTTSEAKKYIEEGHFAKGSMLPKIKAAVEFIEKTGNKALITDPAHLKAALEGKTGTLIVP